MKKTRTNASSIRLDERPTEKHPAGPAHTRARRGALRARGASISHEAWYSSHTTWCLAMSRSGHAVTGTLHLASIRREGCKKTGTRRRGRNGMWTPMPDEDTLADLDIDNAIPTRPLCTVSVKPPRRLLPSCIQIQRYGHQKLHSLLLLLYHWRDQAKPGKSNEGGRILLSIVEEG